MARILVPLFGNEIFDSIALNAAGMLAKRDGALVDARLFCRDMAAVIPFVGEGLTPEIMEQLQVSANVQIEQKTENARSSFNAWCVRGDIPLGDVVSEDEVAANFAVRYGRLPSTIVAPARISDLTIFVGVSENDESDRNALAKAVLIDARRPLLLLPAKAMTTIAQNIVIAWNGTAEAACAISMSLALLKSADRVSIVTVGGNVDPRDLAVTLQSNGVAATPYAVPENETSVTQTLQERAEMLHADLIVIGAYSHSRIRESVLGGVTRDLFKSTSIPTLMMH